MKKLLITILLTFVLLSSASIKVKYVGGVAYVEKPNNKKIRITYDMTINSGDTIITEMRSFVALVLSDKSVHKISANTIYKIENINENKNSRKQTFNLKKGKVFNYISKSFKKSDIKFVTPTAIVGVRGTLISLIHQKGKTILYLLNGQVDVNNPQTGRTESLTPNQKYTSTSKEAKKSEMSEEDVKKATENIPVQVGSFSVDREIDNIDSINKSKIKDELSDIIKEENYRMNEIKSENQESIVWDNEFNKQVGPYTVKQYYKKKDDSTIILDTYTFNGDNEEYLLGLKLTFDGRAPTLEDSISGTLREINNSTMTIRGTSGDNTDTLVYNNDSLNNTKTVTLNNNKADDLEVMEFETIANNKILSHSFPEQLKFKIDGKEHNFDFTINFVEPVSGGSILEEGLDLSDIEDVSVQNQILSGDLATHLQIIYKGDVEVFSKNSGKFDVILLNNYLTILVQ